MRRWIGVLGMGLLAACGPNNTGQLALVVEGVPAGASYNLEVVLPDGSVRSPSTLQTLTSLPSGEYVVRASDIVRSGQNTLKADVRYSKTAESGKAKVESSGITTATVNYNVARLNITVNVTNPSGGASAPSPTVRVLRGIEVVDTLTASKTLALAPGEYTLDAATPPLGSSYEVAVDKSNLVLVAGDNANANVTYSQGFGDFALQITPPSGQSALSAPVVLQSDNGSRFEVNATRTLRLPVGRYSLTATPIELEQIAFAPTPTSSTFDIIKNGSANASVVYAATNSAVVVNVTGAGAGDTVTVRLTPASGPAISRNQTGNGSQRFLVPFGSYTVDASSPRVGTYVDGVIGFRRSLTTTAASFNPSVDAALSPSSFSGSLIAAGNGSNNNRGWNTQFGGVPGLISNSDSAVSISDTTIGSSPAFTTLTGTGRLSSAGLARAAFDSAGNFYALYQNIGTSTTARVIRIGRENLFVNPANFGETAAGNKRIEATNSVTGRDFGLNDLALDSSGNLWLLNAALSVTCVSATQLASTATSITTASQTITLPNSTTLLGNYGPLYAMEFDRSGNLWIVSGDYRPGSSLTRLSRIPTARLTCTSANSGEITPDVRLSITLADASAQVPAILKPYSIALSPDGSTLWIADYGGGSDISGSGGGCPSGSNQTNYFRESIIKVPLNSANTAPNPAGEAIRFAVVTARLTIGTEDLSSTVTNKGMQQPTDLSFDKQGRLWVATNNNVEVDSSLSCYTTTTVDGVGSFSSLVTDERGKLYSIAPAALADNPSTPTNLNAPIQLSPVSQTNFFTISSPNLGQGFTGLAFGN